MRPYSPTKLDTPTDNVHRNLKRIFLATALIICTVAACKNLPSLEMMKEAVERNDARQNKPMPELK